MKRILVVLYTEPVVVLGIATGVSAFLAKQGIVAAWVPLLVLAVATPIARALVSPEKRDGKIHIVKVGKWPS